MATKTQSISRRLDGLKSLVGNTPLLAIDLTYKGEPRRVYAKAENLNMTGSVKDRMALHIIRRSYERGVLEPGVRLVEATSGNTGISFSAIGRACGHPVSIFMPDWMSAERINIIRCFGADMHMVTREQGGFVGSIDMAEDLARNTPNTFLPRQFANHDNIDTHYQTTGPEIWWQTQMRDIRPSAFVAGVGTGGTVMGVGRFLKEMDPSIGVHPLEPANSPTLSTGCRVGKHRIQGVSDEFIPPIVDLDFLDPVVSVDDGDSIIMAQMLAASLGLGVGISSGANFLGALKLQNDLGPDAVVVTVFPDSNKKYLSTDLLKDEPVGEDFLSPDIELLGFESFGRACRTCLSPGERSESCPAEECLST